MSGAKYTHVEFTADGVATQGRLFLRLLFDFASASSMQFSRCLAFVSLFSAALAQVDLQLVVAELPPCAVSISTPLLAQPNPDLFSCNVHWKRFHRQDALHKTFRPASARIRPCMVSSPSAFKIHVTKQRYSVRANPWTLRLAMLSVSSDASSVSRPYLQRHSVSISKPGNCPND